MAFNISTFLSNMTNDGFRPNLFDVEVTFPDSLNANSSRVGRNVMFKGKSTTIPSSDIGISSVYYYGREVKFAGNREFAPWTVTFLMDEIDFDAYDGVRGIFESWSSYINSHYTNTRFASFKSPTIFTGYMGTIQIRPMSKVGGTYATGSPGNLNFGLQQEFAGNFLEIYKLRGCYPIEVGELSLSWEDNNRIAEFSVTFEYQWWESNPVNSEE